MRLSSASQLRAVLLLLLCLVPVRAPASPAPGDDSIRARIKACIALGDLNCGVVQTP